MTSVTYLHHKIAADTLAARLIIMRHELGWSQRKAAALTGVPFGVWQGMETGRESRGLDRRIAAIADVSGYDRDWLMWGGNLSPDPHAPASQSRPTREYANLRATRTVHLRPVRVKEAA